MSAYTIWTLALLGAALAFWAGIVLQDCRDDATTTMLAVPVIIVHGACLVLLIRALLIGLGVNI